MKIAAFLVVIAMMSVFCCKAQTIDTTSTKSWSVNTVLTGVLFPDGNILMPIVIADKNKLHLVSRYNYEDLNTFSLFTGYNFTGGNKLQYRITPMLGLVVGNTDGIAPGMEAELNLGKFRFYTEIEYVFELNAKENSFFYSWSEINFAPKDWFWFGISWQRLKPYLSENSLDKGFVAGFAFKQFSLLGYYFNPGADTQFGIIGLGCRF